MAHFTPELLLAVIGHCFGSEIFWGEYATQQGATMTTPFGVPYTSTERPTQPNMILMTVSHRRTLPNAA